MSGTRWPSRIDRALLIAIITGVLLLVGSLLSIFIHTHSAYMEIERVVFSTDPQMGRLLDTIPRDERLRLFSRVSEWPDDHLHEASGLGLLGVLIIGWAARRLGRRSGIPLGLIACSVLLPVALGLTAGLLAMWRFDDLLGDSFELLTGRSLPIGALGGGCTLSLTPCARVQALELVWTITVEITCVLTAIVFVLAARRAWVIGQRGTTLPRRWAIGAMVLFGLGVVSLVGSVPYAADHASECDDGYGYYDYDLSIHNSTSTDLHGVMVESCGDNPWKDYMDARGLEDIVLAASVQVLRDGSVGMLSESEGDPVEFVTPDQFTEVLEVELYGSRQIREARGEPPLDESVALYIDERTPARAIREHLIRARAVGVTTIVVLGQSRVEDSLESVGTWTRRYLCPIATIRFDEGAFELSDFETWGEIIMRAIELDPEPLRLQP